MYIYADESGHTGKHIFNEPLFYLQGAILSVADPELLLRPTADHFKKKLHVGKLHANELGQEIVEEVASAFLDCLNGTDWEFHLTVIEKPYLAVTKFVDSLFDTSENKGARWLWYHHEFFRHTLCCFFDELLSVAKKKIFWKAYLEDNHNDVCNVVKWASDRIDKVETDKRLKEVTKDALFFALEYPGEITLMASKTRRSYKGHTPNMVAFSSLIQDVHRFCRDRNVTPQAFVHDPQSEFRGTMREYHTLFSRVRVKEHRVGLPQGPEEVEYDPAQFALTPSENLASLQAVDMFLWLSQRTDGIKSKELKEALRGRMKPFYISRALSEMIVFSWNRRLETTEFTEEQLTSAKEILREMEQTHFKKLNEFSTKRLTESE